MKEYKTAVIGSGPAGLTAAIYLARARLNPTVFAGTNFGGQLMITTSVDNYPGFPDGIQGPDLINTFIKQATNAGADIIYSDVTKADFANMKYIITANDQEYEFDGIVTATGGSYKKLGIENEYKLTGRGVSYCATCDGPFFKDKVIAVVGGGDSAMEESIFLTKFATKVYLIHRRDTFRASKIMQDKVMENEKIEILYNTEIVDVEGTDKLTGIKIKNNLDNKESELKLDGLFIAIGHKPNTDIFKGQLEINEAGYLVIHDGTRTSVEGVFSAGDVDDFKYKQVVTGAGEGCKAALDLEKYLAGISVVHG